MNKTKIDWADYTWNPVWGCRNNCPYCYARKAAQRFGESFEPHWKEKNFQRAMPKKPSMIFVDSMSDIAYWEDEWIDKVSRRMDANMQHTFLFLTKKPECYRRLDAIFSQNCWFGITITDQSAMNHCADVILKTRWHIPRRGFFSIEPLLERIDPLLIPDWLIIGAETGNRKGKVIPEVAWVQDLVDFVQCKNIPIWLKENLRGIWPGKLIQEKPNTGDVL